MSLPSMAHDPVGAELDANQDAVDRFQREIEEIFTGDEAKDDMKDEIKAGIQRAVQHVLGGKTHDGTMTGAVEAAIQEARAAVKQIVDRHRQARGQQEAGGATGNTLVDTTYALGSFIAQAAIGGAELPTILQEEEVAYSAQSAVMPLRQLAASTETGAEKDALTGHAAPDGALTREHTRPSPAAAQVGQAEEAKAKQGREAQQEELVKRTGDTLYPPSEGDQAANEPTAAAAEKPLSTGMAAGLQEENWTPPAAAAKGSAPTAAPGDVKGSKGHSLPDMPTATN